MNGNDLTVVKTQLYDYSVEKYVVKSGIKLWICDANGNKLDYRYTNSQGIAWFEMPEGKYR